MTECSLVIYSGVSLYVKDALRESVEVALHKGFLILLEKFRSLLLCSFGGELKGHVAARNAAKLNEV